MSYKRAETLGDASRHGLWIEIIYTGELLERGKFGAGATLAAAGARMRCRGKNLEGGGCGHRGATVRAVFQPSGPDDDGPTGGGNVVPFPLEQRGEAPAERRRRRA